MHGVVVVVACYVGDLHSSSVISVFIYSCPNGAKIKAKMLYSTVKAAATGAAEDCGVKIEKKVRQGNGPPHGCSLYCAARDLGRKRAGCQPAQQRDPPCGEPADKAGFQEADEAWPWPPAYDGQALISQWWKLVRHRCDGVPSFSAPTMYFDSRWQRCAPTRPMDASDQYKLHNFIIYDRVHAPTDTDRGRRALPQSTVCPAPRWC